MASSSKKVALIQPLKQPIVSRILARSEVNKFDIELDVNTDIYPMENQAYYAMALASSLNADSSEEFDVFQY